jgi:hypothetical protein
MEETNASTVTPTSQTTAENPVKETTTLTGSEQTDAANPVAKDEGTAKEGGETKPKVRTFTQEEVNQLVQDRLGKVYSKYGMKDADELDEAIGRSQSYEVTKERYESAVTEIADLKAQLAFLQNGIDPARYDDVKAYFKGKGLSIDTDSLKSEASTHLEWAMKKPETTTVAPLGSDKNGGSSDDGDKKYAAMFGLPGFVD